MPLSALFRHRFALFAGCCAAGCVLSGGCSGGDEAAHEEQAVEEASGVTELAEVDLGQFTVTDRDARSKATRFVGLHVFAVVPKQEVEAFTHLHEAHRERVRGRVISLIRQTDTRELADPELKLLRSKLAVALRREMKTDLLEQVVFGDFSVELL